MREFANLEPVLDSRNITVITCYLTDQMSIKEAMSMVGCSIDICYGEGLATITVGALDFVLCCELDGKWGCDNDQ